jgi:hypothetical protein
MKPRRHDGNVIDLFTPEPIQPPVYGVCCRCKRQPATVKSPSGKEQEIYCEKCARSRCGRHTILDFVYSEQDGGWVDPCVVANDQRPAMTQQKLMEG